MNAEVIAGPPCCFPQFAGPIHRVVRLEQRQQDRHQHRIADRPRRQGPGLAGVVGRRSDRQLRADRLDSVLVAVLVDEPHHHFCGRSSPLREESRRLLQNLVGSTQLTILLLELLHLLPVSRRHPRSLTGVDLGLTHPGSDRFDAVAELLSDPLHRALRRPQLLTELEHQPHRLGLLLRGIATRRRLPRCRFSCHNSHPRCQDREPPLFPGRFRAHVTTP